LSWCLLIVLFRFANAISCHLLNGSFPWCDSITSSSSSSCSSGSMASGLCYSFSTGSILIFLKFILWRTESQNSLSLGNLEDLLLKLPLQVSPIALSSRGEAKRCPAFPLRVTLISSSLQNNLKDVPRWLDPITKWPQIANLLFKGMKEGNS